jgi:hypothetical protein
MTYSDKLKDPRWQQKRLLVMQRDFWRCRDCNNSHNELQVHHCFYENGNPWETDDAFLITLCGPCHLVRHEKEREVKRAVSLAMAGMTKAQLDEAAALSVNSSPTGAEDLLSAITISIARRNYEENGMANKTVDCQQKV